MGILNIFKKGKKDLSTEELNELEQSLMDDSGIVGEVEHGGPVVSEPEPVPEVKRCSFVMGVHDVIRIEGTNNIKVTGNLKGNAESNMVVSVLNFGDDSREMVMTNVVGVEVNDAFASSVTDCRASLILEGMNDKKIGIGTVIYSRDMNEDSVHDAYVGTLGDTYVKERKLELTDEEIAGLSITDCSEIWRLNGWYMSHEGKDEPDDIKAARKERLDKLVAALCDKILNADTIYYVHDKKTGEAHLFSQAVDKGDGTYICTPPSIMLVSKAYHRHYKKLYSNDKLELAIVRNGADKKGIYNFLAGNFYINGACGAAIGTVQTSISAGMLVEKPDHTGIPVENIPVTNPDLVRWMLLIGQMDTPKDGDNTALLFKLYYKFMGMEMLKARFIIPLRHEENEVKTDSQGHAVTEQDFNFNIATMKGKGSKEAVIMYTDWRRLRSEYGREWDGMVHTMGGMIDMFDCAVNPTRFPAAGTYVTREMYDNMQKIAGEKK
ncbi:MAG: hypothetical protein IKP31_03745 [Lachnospiraceae bacterium]|nr:hypothetical protein [Lachnospiraceae bacterium]